MLSHAMRASVQRIRLGMTDREKNIFTALFLSHHLRQLMIYQISLFLFSQNTSSNVFNATIFISSSLPTVGLPPLNSSAQT
jgi:hypothetical protein